jgi:hypothetical protein
MKAKKILALSLAMTLFLGSAAQGASGARCPNGRSAEGAMWFSILHPGLGEYHLKGWGPWSNMPQKKFWFGFIPFYGWPGYLQVKSAIDARNCRTNDDISLPK